MARARLRQQRRRCEAILSAIPVPRPLDIWALCAAVAADRGRPIRLLPAALPRTGPCGLWIAAEGADYLVYEENTSLVHQEHIILHELGHLLCEHAGVPAGGDHTAGQVGWSGSVGGGGRYSAPEEVEAELMASLLRGRGGWNRRDRGTWVGTEAERFLWDVLLDER